MSASSARMFRSLEQFADRSHSSASVRSSLIALIIVHPLVDQRAACTERLQLRNVTGSRKRVKRLLSNDGQRSESLRVIAFARQFVENLIAGAQMGDSMKPRSYRS